MGAEDIPGENKVSLGGSDAQIFASDKVHYLHQPLGLIIAETPSLAERAAQLVQVDYSHHQVAVLLDPPLPPSHLHGSSHQPPSSLPHPLNRPLEVHVMSLSKHR